MLYQKKRWLMLCSLLILTSLLTVNIVTAQGTIPLPEPNKAVAPKKLWEGEGVKITNFAKAYAPAKVQVPDTYGQWTLPASNSPRVPPANDNFANTLDLGTVGTTPLTASVNTIEESTMEQDELTFCYNHNNSVWFKFTVAADTVVDIDTAGSNYDTYQVLYRNPGGTDLAYKACVDDYYTLQGAFIDFELKAGTYYLQVLNYGSSALSGPSNLELEIRLSSQALPRPFYLYAPYESTYAAVPYYFNWLYNDGAVTYDLTIERIASPVAGNPLEVVVAVTGLTPAADSDALDCTNAAFDCIYLIPASEAANLTAEGDVYAWSVNAVNANGSTAAMGDSSPTTTEFALDFTETPENIYLSSPYGVYIAAPTEFYWGHAIDAETYNFIVNDIPPVRATIINKTGLTPEADSDGLLCNYYSCLLTLTPAEAALLLDNTQFEWSASSVNTNGPTVNSFIEFEIDSTPAPFDFFVNTQGLYVNTEDLTFFYFDHADYATSYDLTVSNSVPADIITETGLTPADDTDAFTCYPEGGTEAEMYCYYYISTTQQALFVDGDYTLSATANNANGSTVAYNAPSLFRVLSVLAYDQLTPANDSTFATETDLTSFTWEEITTAGWTADVYTFYNYGTLASHSANMALMTPAADFDRLTCAAGTCTLDVTGLEIGNFRNGFYWYAYVNGTLDTTSYGIYADNASFFYTIGDVPENDQLLLNNSFEVTAARAKFPADWTAKNLTAGAGQKCNKDKDGDGVIDKIVANSGSCAFMMKGIGSTGKLQQTVDTATLLEGDTLWLSAYYDTNNTVAEGAPQIKLTVKYTDTTVEKTKVTLDIPAGTTDEFTYVETSADVASAPSKVKVQISYKGVGGKVYFDPVYLYLEVPVPRNGVIALPNSTTNGLGNRNGNETNGLGARQ
jgi:hypothetical protein